MELRHLKYFVAVAEAGSFTRAAERLHTVQSSLTRQIQDLEHYIGTRLIERGGRPLRLTPAGKAFLDEAKLALAQAERAVERARQAARDNAGRLTLGFLLGSEIDLMMRVMTTLHGELESIELVMRSESSPDLIEALNRRELDAAFVRPDADCHGLLLQPLPSERLMAALPQNHRLADADSVHLEELKGDPFVRLAQRFAPVFNGIMAAYTAAHGIDLTDSYEAENISMAFSLISSLGGVSLLPEYASRMLPRSVKAVPLADAAPTIGLALAYHPETRSPLLKSFLTSFLKTIARDNV
jgi:LysR family hca operon transcriptional activator